MTMQMNQFTIQPLKGALASLINTLTLSVQLDPASSADYLVPGDFVKIVDTTGPQIIVDVCEAADASIGSIIYVPKKDKFYPGDTFEIGGAFTIMFMEASAAISRGAQLEFVPTGSKVKTNAGNPVCGIALDNASGSGSLLRVLLINPYTLAATITSGSINGVAIGGSTPAAGTFTSLIGTVIGSAAAVVVTPGATPAVNATLGQVFTLTPAEAEALTTTGAIVGQDVYLLVTTSGTNSYTLTFGSGFTSTGTLATGATSGKKFLVHFKCVVAGALVEVSRTTAM